MVPMIEISENTKIEVKNLDVLLNNMIDIFIKTHTLSKKAHEEMISMSHIDDDIAKIFSTQELTITKRIVDILKNNNIIIDNAYEKVHIIIGIIENLCHEIVYHKHKEINYDIMKKEVIKIVEGILVVKPENKWSKGASKK